MTGVSLWRESVQQLLFFLGLFALVFIAMASSSEELAHAINGRKTDRLKVPEKASVPAWDWESALEPRPS